MKANEIKVGGKYWMKVSGNVVPVEVVSINETSGWKGRSRTTYGCRNLTTGRPCGARSAQKFRDEYKPPVKAPTAQDVKAMFDATDRAAEIRRQSGDGEISSIDAVDKLLDIALED